MKTVLYPAIALMNRLSFGMKFGLISVLFFLPLLITSFYLVRDAYRQFSDTRIELQSLTLLGSGLQIRRGTKPATTSASSTPTGPSTASASATMPSTGRPTTTNSTSTSPATR